MARLPDKEVDENTLFYTGSTTKAMIAAVIGQLMHSDESASQSATHKTLQKDKWQTKISTLLPNDFKMQDRHATSTATVKDALAHRTGLSGADCMYGDWMGQSPRSVTAAIRDLGELDEPIRSAYQYNNLMYSVVGTIIEDITGLSCDSALKKYLWEPLEMLSTFWKLDEATPHQLANLARGYFWVRDDHHEAGGYHVPEPYLSFAGIAPAGATVSSASDYVKWARELLRAASELDKPSVISHILFRELTSPSSIMPSTVDPSKHFNPNLYSMGWIHAPPVLGLEHPILSHGGGLTGFGATIYVLPEDNFGCVILGNTELWSNIIGELLCLELIARRLSITGASKTAFIQSLKTKLPPDSDDAEATQKGVQSLEQCLSNSTLDANTVKGYCGRYTHPAYGVFEITPYKAAIDDENGAEILYLPWHSRSQRNERSNRRNNNRPLQVTPVGHHTWKYQILLHPNESLLETGDASPRREFFDQEYLACHGNVEDDACGASSDVTQTFNSIQQPRLRWQSRHWSKNGAVFVWRDDIERHKGTPQLGLRLATEHVASDGSTDQESERQMVWFVKEG